MESKLQRLNKFGNDFEPAIDCEEMETVYSLVVVDVYSSQESEEIRSLCAIIESNALFPLTVCKLNQNDEVREQSADEGEKKSPIDNEKPARDVWFDVTQLKAEIVASSKSFRIVDDHL